MTDYLQLVSTPASMVPTRKQKWLWVDGGLGVIPVQSGTQLFGQGGSGKTTLALYVAAQLTRGQLPGAYLGAPQTVGIVAPEDDAGVQLVPRLSAAGANLDRVHIMELKDLRYSGVVGGYLTFPRDVARFETWVSEFTPRLIMFDPITALIEGNINNSDDVRAALMPVESMAAEHDFAYLMINHVNKGSGHVSDRSLGSTALRNVPRSSLFVARDEDTGLVYVEQEKNNYGVTMGKWEFGIKTVQVPTDDGEQSEIGTVTGLQETDFSASEIMNRDPNETSQDRNDAQEFIYNFLKNKEDNEAPSRDIIKAGNAEGFTQDQLRKARKRMKNPTVTSVRLPGLQAGTAWRLEETVTGGVGRDNSEPNHANHATHATQAGHSQPGLNGPHPVKDREPGTLTPNQATTPDPGINGMNGINGLNGPDIEGNDAQQTELVL